MCDQTIRTGGLLLASGLRHPMRRIRFKDPGTGKRLVFLTSNFAPASAHYHRAVSMPVAGRVVFQINQAASSH